MMPAGNNCIIHIPEQVLQLLEGDPLTRLLCVVVVDIHDQHVGPEEVLDAAVVLLINRAHVIEPHRLLQLLRPRDLHRIRIKAVLSILGHPGCL